MKLRIRNNSIRLRLRQGDVRRFATDGLVEARTDFGAGIALAYALLADDVPTLLASFDGRRILVRVPRDAAARWTSTDAVALDAPPSPASPLKVLIEKDFACTDAPADEPQDDAYPNPNHCT